MTARRLSSLRALVCTASLAWCAAALADEAPATAPATTQASQPQVRVDPAAVALLRESKAALDRIGAFSVAGRLTARFDVAGRQRTHTAEIRTLMAPDGRFRHELVGIGIICGDGKTVTFYDARRNAFGTAPLAAKIGPAAEAYEPLVDVLEDENPLLLAALTTEPQLLLGRKADAITAGPEPGTLHVDGTEIAQTLVFDAGTHVLQRIDFDLRKRFKARGATAAVASVEIVYEDVKPAPALAADAFAYTPPPTATEFALEVEKPANELVESDSATQPAPSPATQPAGEPFRVR